MFSLVTSGFGLGTPPLLPSVFLIVESWTLTLTEANEACSSSDVVLVPLWPPGWVVAGVLRWCWSLVHSWEGSPLFHVFSISGSLESWSFRNGSATFPRLYFSSVLGFLRIFGSFCCRADFIQSDWFYLRDFLTEQVWRSSGFGVIGGIELSFPKNLMSHRQFMI